MVPLSPSLDTAGVLARNVADATLAFAAIDPLTEMPAAALLAHQWNPGALFKITTGKHSQNLKMNKIKRLDLGLCTLITSKRMTVASSGKKLPFPKFEKCVIL